MEIPADDMALSDTVKSASKINQTVMFSKAVL
jgi:hypothetical protein